MSNIIAQWQAENFVRSSRMPFAVAEREEQLLY